MNYVTVLIEVSNGVWPRTSQCGHCKYDSGGSAPWMWWLAASNLDLRYSRPDQQFVLARVHSVHSWCGESKDHSIYLT